MSLPSAMAATTNFFMAVLAAGTDAHLFFQSQHCLVQGVAVFQWLPLPFWVHQFIGELFSPLPGILHDEA